MPKKKKTVNLPVLALRGLMGYPNMVLHFDVGRAKSIAALEQAMVADQQIMLITQKDVEVDDPSLSDLCKVGTVATIKQAMNLPNDSIRVLVEGQTRGVIEALEQEEPYMSGRIRLMEDDDGEGDPEMQALMRATQEFFEQFAGASQRMPQETIASVRDIEMPGHLADVIAANVLTGLEDRQALLEETDVKRRLEKLCGILVRETELAGLEKQVQARIKKQIEKNQKDYYLREQIKAIQTELGDTEANDVEELRAKMEKLPLNEEARQKCEKEIERLSRMAPGTPEIGVSRTYIEWILDLPWGETTPDNLDLKRARKVLAQDHYGLEKVKERIVEYQIGRAHV